MMAPGTKATNGLAESQRPATQVTNGKPDKDNSILPPASSAPGNNRKKQKRREKQAARLAVEQGSPSSTQAENGSVSPEQHRHIPQGYLTTENGLLRHSHSNGLSVAPLNPGQEQNHGFVDREYEATEHFDGAAQGEAEDLYYSDEDGHLYPAQYNVSHHPANGHPAAVAGGEKRSKRKKKGKRALQQTADGHYPSATPHMPGPPPPPPPPPPAVLNASRTGHALSRDRIWNTSTSEERERIKEFWLSLGEEDRRSLVKVEKEAVLRKMKEQQKHSCSCTVCGRKRTAIEEELEVLYDAYYEELEQYANNQQAHVEDSIPVMPPPRRSGRPGRMPPHADRLPPLPNFHPPSTGRIRELADDEEVEAEAEAEEDEDFEGEEYSDEGEEVEGYSDEEIAEAPRGPAQDFFNFGNSLTVQGERPVYHSNTLSLSLSLSFHFNTHTNNADANSGGILTVADDLLKNDGKKFIEMMEQLAERRMQREEEAQYAAAGLAHPAATMTGQHHHASHDHALPPDEEDYDDEEEDDDDYDSQDEEEYDDDEMVSPMNPMI